MFGGVRGEWKDLATARYDDVYCINLLFLPLRVMDLPLSVIGDTLTLPYTLLRDPTFLRQTLVYEPQEAAWTANRPAPPPTPVVADR